MTDRTEQRLADELSNLRQQLSAAQASQAKYQREAEAYRGTALFAQLNPAPVLRFDRNGMILMTNSAAREILGDYAREGTSLASLLPSTAEINFSECIQQSLVIPHEVEVGHRTFQFVIRGIPEINAAHAYGSDITEHKQAEEARLRLAEENATLSEIGRIIGSTLDIEEVYERFAIEVKRLVDFDRINVNVLDRSTGLMTIKYLHGESTPERHVGTVLPLEGSLSEQVLQTRRALIRDDIAQDTQFSGETDHLSAGLRSSITIPLIAKGEIAGTLVLRSHQPGAYGEREEAILGRLAYQIAPAVENARLYEQIQINQEALREHAEELSRSNAELEQFAYVASHDLQEPLRSISGFVRLLTRRYASKLDEDADRFMNRISNATLRMQELINDLLAYSRVGRDIDEFASTNCDEIVAQEVGNLQRAVEESGASIIFDPLPTVTADAALLRQIFRNLIANGIKFRGAELPRIQITAEQSQREWVFSVRDNGIGIEPQYTQRIFTIFQRLHTREEYAGTGIGLSICKKAVDRLGGRIWVESQPGEGSTFYFTVPMTRNGRRGASS